MLTFDIELNGYVLAEVDKHIDIYYVASNENCHNLSYVQKFNFDTF